MVLKNENIICISSIDWDFIWQGHQEIMSTLARNGNRVLFIENTGVRAPSIRDIPRIKNRIKNWFKGVRGIRKEMDNLYVLSPLVLPFPYFRIARWINLHLILPIVEKWMQVMDFNNPIIWTFLPTGLSLDLINSINKKATIYYCIDNFAVSSSLAHKVKFTEQKIIKQSDLVFVTAKGLYDYCSQYSSKVHTFPFGVNITGFERIRAAQKPTVPKDIMDIKRPIVGYIGGLHKWVDQGLIKTLAQTHPGYSFVFIGPLQTDISGLSNITNIHFFGYKPHQELPQYVNCFSAGIIPYLLTEYTKNVYPTKLNEYLSLGKPVVSTSLAEVKAFNERYANVVLVAENDKEFGKFLEKTINNSDEETIKRRIQVAKDNTWQKRIEQMSELIEEAIKRRKQNKDLKWKESLLRFYRISRRRARVTVITCLLAYFLLFYTPFLWFVASPLKISQVPRPADVIAVFAGGVGESGKPGQGYEERVLYSVELYKNGFSKKLIFSSGYTYALQEAEVMKALAVSLGIPEEDIILEKSAANTFQNVKFTKEIMEKNNWDSALVVSSPYHMRRVSLVFNKITPDTKVIYSPIPTSRFYSHGIGAKEKKIWKQIHTRQINGILHEYLGIVYYWWKGYI